MTDYTNMPTWSLEKLARVMADDSSTTRKGLAMAEVYRRQLVFQQQASEAQQTAAEYTKKNARYMLWSVIALAVSSALSLLLAVLTRV